MSNQEDEFEELRRRFKKLNDDRIRAERDLEHASEEIDRLKNSAMEQFGTDDPEELKVKLEAMQKENAEKIKSYRQSIEEIEKGLKELESDEDGK